MDWEGERWGVEEEKEEERKGREKTCDRNGKFRGRLPLSWHAGLPGSQELFQVCRVT